MKTAIYIEDGVTQVVLTPETEHEKAALEPFRGNEIEARLFTGSFYDCRGGWVRQTAYREMSDYGLESEDRSLILRAGARKEDAE